MKMKWKENENETETKTKMKPKQNKNDWLNTIDWTWCTGFNKLNTKLTQIDELFIENYKDELKQSWMPFSSSHPRALALV